MTGALPVVKEGRYAIASSTSTAKVWIDSVECTGTGCASLPLSAGPHDIRIDVSSSNHADNVEVSIEGIYLVKGNVHSGDGHTNHGQAKKDQILNLAADHDWRGDIASNLHNGQGDDAHNGDHHATVTVKDRGNSSNNFE